MMQKPVLEWICAVISGALTLATIVVVAAEIPGGDAAAPDLSVTIGATRPSGSGHVVPIEISNAADTTAAGVEIEASLSDAEGTVETSRITVDYVPRNSSTRAGLLFSQDPANYELNVKAVGYQEP